MPSHLQIFALTLAAVSSAAGAVTLTPVPNANPKTPGFAAPNVLSPELDHRLIATGSIKLDGASSITTYYGYINSNNGTVAAMVPVDLVKSVTTSTPAVEATKTEPDKNTYLVFDPSRGAQQQVGPDASYNYGTHFLYQGHEVGDHGYITRINLDADGAHRVTLLADVMSDGVSIVPNIDGSTWDPFAGKLLFTGEEAGDSGVLEGVVLQATPNYPSSVTKLDGVFGHAGWEGIQPDSSGNLWLVADQGGPTSTLYPTARQPNSFVYRFVPKNRADLAQGGQLQALQVTKLDGSGPIVFHAGQSAADVLSQDVKDLHTYGNRFNTKWVVVHDTAVNGFTPFDANALAKTASATPFKRPENGVFRPSDDRRFGEFFFTETGDTNDSSQVVTREYGKYGAVFRLAQNGPNALSGVLSLFYLSDRDHSGFDNIQFVTDRQLAVVEDAGDTMHRQRNALDSGYLFDVALDYSNAFNQPLRFLAEGRDASATLDAHTGGLNQNGDNEITGIHISNGDPGVSGILGARVPTPFNDGWRVFWTQQHGDNNAWEIVPATRR
jgi:Bacterial protein of unknown function (DUF839)